MTARSTHRKSYKDCRPHTSNAALHSFCVCACVCVCVWMCTNHIFTLFSHRLTAEVGDVSAQMSPGLRRQQLGNNFYVSLTHTCTRSLTHICTHICSLHTSKHTRFHVRAHAHTHTHTRTYTHTHTYTHVHTHIHVHTHTSYRTGACV
jgi:hypothetical protein